MASDVLYGYALIDDTNSVVCIKDIDRVFSRSHKFFCPYCHNEMYATFGEVKRPHFRHRGNNCVYNKYLHSLAERVFYEEYSKCLNEKRPFFLEIYVPVTCNNACVLWTHADCKERYISRIVDLTEEYTRISLETNVNIDNRYWRPDILLETINGKQCWIEIWVSHETVEEKRKKGNIIEIKIDSEDDLLKIRQHKLVQSEREDNSVRFFGVQTDLFKNEESLMNNDYPCEKYFCFEVTKEGVKSQIIPHIPTYTSNDLLYKVILRLNWLGEHNVQKGIIKKKTFIKDLKEACSQRYYSFGARMLSYRNTTFDSLIVYEWRADSFKPSPIYPNYQISQHLTPAYIDFSNIDIEWINLGLPSGILWAKDERYDIKATFIEAVKLYKSHLPSQENAQELLEYCVREWDDVKRRLIFTGPTGKSISFPCDNNNVTYWLDKLEKEDRSFGHCFHLGPDKHFWINNKDITATAYIRLVNR